MLTGIDLHLCVFIGITHGFPLYPRGKKQETRRYLLPEDDKGKCMRHSCVLELLFMNKRKWRPLEGGEVIIPRRVINIGEEKQNLERGIEPTNSFHGLSLSTWQV